MHILRSLFTPGSLLLLGTVSCLPAQADLVTYEFTGHIAAVFDNAGLLDGSIHDGDTYSGRFTYDTDAPDALPQADFGEYYLGPPSGYSPITLGNYTFAQDPSFTLVDVANQSRDLFQVTGFATLPNNVSLAMLVVNLADPTGTAFASDVLPPTLPSLDAFSVRLGDFQLTDNRTSQQSHLFTITDTLTLVVPEPGSCALVMSLGVPGLLMARRRRRRENKR